MTQTNPSFIDAAITKMSDQKTQFGSIARRVQKQPHASPLNRIAMTFVALQNERVNNRIAGNIAAMSGIDTPERLGAGTARNDSVKPELLFNFLQNLQNGLCWSARRLYRDQLMADTGKEASEMDFTDIPGKGPSTNGVDFSERTGDELGVEGVSTDRIKDVVQSDFDSLSNVHSWLLGKMNYLTEVEELRMFADYRPPADGGIGSGSWELRYAADSFDTAMDVMATIIEELALEEVGKTGAEAQTMDFAS